MMDKTTFQLRILDRFGFLPTFEGEFDSTVRLVKKENENFTDWCSRVLARTPQSVRIFMPVAVNGAASVGDIDSSTNHELQAIVKKQRKKSLERGVEIGMTSLQVSSTNPNLVPLRKERLNAMLTPLFHNFEGGAYNPYMRDFDDAATAELKAFIADQPDITDWETVLVALAKEFAKLVEERDKRNRPKKKELYLADAVA